MHRQVVLVNFNYQGGVCAGGVSKIFAINALFDTVTVMCYVCERIAYHHVKGDEHVVTCSSPFTLHC